MKFLDLHTHILPCVDDGSQCMEESLHMLKNAQASHVAILVATPHCNVPPYWENYSGEALQSKFAQLQSRAEEAGIPVRVCPGAEVRVTRELPWLLREGKLPTINNTQYMLTEFLPWTTEPQFRTHLEQILSSGRIPLIAHPERYELVCRMPVLVEQWLEMGCHVQLTAGSILGKFGSESKRAADFLLRSGLVACVASDAHGARRRTNFLTETYDHLQLHYSKAYAQALMWEIPLRICSGEEL